MYKIILLLLISLQAMAQDQVKYKQIFSEKKQSWLIEHGVIKNQNQKDLNIYSAKILSNKESLELKIECRVVIGKENNYLGLSIKNINNAFWENQQHVNFIFYTNHLSVSAKTNDKKTLIINNFDNINYRLVNLIGNNRNLEIRYKDNKNQPKNDYFDLNGSYEVTSFLGKKCFIEPKKIVEKLKK